MKENTLSKKGYALTVIILVIGISIIPGSSIIVEGVGEGDVQPPVTTIDFGEPYYANIYITSDTLIYLNATDDESGVNATYYRINDGKWGKYAAPFSILEDCNHTIYFYSVDNASNKESIKNKNVSVDNYPPFPVIPLPGGENGWYVNSVLITFIDAEEKSGISYIQYRIDGGSWIVYVGPFMINGDGYHTLDYYAIDNVGNEGTGSFSIKIDQTPPTTTHEFKGIVGDNDWFVSNTTVTLNAEDETSGVDYTMYKIDDGEWITYTGPFNVCGDGMHILYYYSVDFAGNVEDVKGPFEFKIDQTDPTIFLTAEKIYPNTWLIMADVSDETSGVKRVEFYVNDELLGEVTEPPYEWIYSHRLSVRGLILNPEFTEETVSFFAVIAIHSSFNNPVSQAIVFDNAGNEAVSPIPTSLINNNRFGIYLFQQLTFQNSYSGYIGRFFINAVFD